MWCTVINQQLLRVVLVRSFLALAATLLLYVLLAWRHDSSKITNTVTVYAYCDMLSSDDFDEFTERTGIQVVVRHFETIEEVMTKLVFTQDGEIDIVAPTDAMVEVLRNQNLLLPLQKKELPSIKELNPLLMKRFYDLENEHTVPFSWTPIGIGYDKRVIKKPAHKIGWDLIFGKEVGGITRSPAQVYKLPSCKVCLGEDPLESIFLVMLHKYRRIIKNMSPQQGAEIVHVLKKQKEWIECYTNNLRYFLISEVCPAIAIPAAYMIQTCADYEWADFVIPSVGTVMFVGNLGISVRSKKVAQAHAVIEYLISRRGSLTCFENHLFLPANSNACKELPEAVRSHPYLFPTGGLASRLYTLHNAISLNKLQRMWHGVIV